MNEKAINELLNRLIGTIPDKYLQIIKEQAYITFNNYEIRQKETSLQTRADDLCRELQEFVIAKKVEGMSNGTIKLYHRTISNFLFYVNKPVNDITTGDILAFLHSYQATRKVKDITLDNTRIHISTFYNWLVNSDYIDKNPCKKIKPIKHEKNTRNPLTAVQMEKLRNSITDLRDKAIIEFLYATACRVGELVIVKKSDVDYERKEVHLFGKGKKHRVSYLNARAVVALQAYLESREDDSEYLFVGIRKPHKQLSARAVELLLQKYGKKAGINAKCTPHIIRHTTATDAINKGMPVEQLQKLLGHEQIETSLHYAKVSSDIVKIEHQKYIV